MFLVASWHTGWHAYLYIVLTLNIEYKSSFLFQFWLDPDKPMNQQIGLSSSEPMLRFMVKFYIPDPSQLEEEYTRYLFSMQIKRDLATGHLQCNDNTAALMASYIVQGKDKLVSLSQTVNNISKRGFYNFIRL